MLFPPFDGERNLILLIFLCSMLGAFGAWSIAKYGSSLKLMDCPNARSSHNKPIPRGGGIGILAAFFLSCWILEIPVGFWLSAGIISLLGQGGEIFILDMGQPVRIVDLVKDLIRLNGLDPEKDIPIQFIGLRPGEKIYEELITEGEGIVGTSHDKIMVLRGDHCDNQKINRQVDELLEIAGTYDAMAIKNKLQEIVPEYTPQFV